MNRVVHFEIHASEPERVQKMTALLDAWWSGK